VPALGETSIPPRIRVGLAAFLALVIYPAVAASLPVLPQSIFALLYALLAEAVTGVMIGGAARLIMSALNIAGTVIAFQGSLSIAQGFDPTQGQQGVLISTFLVLLATTMIFVTDLHHLLLAAIVRSFQQFPPGRLPPIADFADLVTCIMAQSFVLAVQLAAPFIAYGLVFYVGLGLLARLMPQLQVFFIAMPLNIFLTFVVMFMVAGVMMTWFLGGFEDVMRTFTG